MPLQKRSLSTTKRIAKWMIAVAIFICPAITFSQNFVAVDSGFNSNVRRLEIDTTGNLLYAFGNFSNAGGSTPVNYLAQYDGVKWDSIPLMNNFNTTYSTSFAGKIIFGNSPVYSWDGIQIDTIAVFPFGPAILGAIEYNGELYGYGGFDSIGGIAASNIAKWNGGTSWSALDTTKFFSGGAIVSAIEYLGNLYFAGNVISTTGSIYDLAKWDGTALTQLDNGIVGGFSSVGSFEIYNGDLYIGGNFNVAAGNPGNSIARWDGTQWKDTGGGFPITNSIIYDLQVFNGELYAAGNYTVAGGQPIKAIAKWDETNWCGLGFNSPSAECMTVYNNELYIGGSFLTINGDTMNRITKWNGGTFTDFCGNTTGMAESMITNESLNVFPNPAGSIINIQIDLQKEETASFEIRNVLGQIVYSKKDQLSQGKQLVEIDVSEFSNGVYFVQLLQGDKISRAKFIKQ